jgi:hypothetical protein
VAAVRVTAGYMSVNLVEARCDEIRSLLNMILDTNHPLSGSVYSVASSYLSDDHKVKNRVANNKACRSNDDPFDDS